MLNFTKVLSKWGLASPTLQIIELTIEMLNKVSMRNNPTENAFLNYILSENLILAEVGEPRWHASKGNNGTD